MQLMKKLLLLFVTALSFLIFFTVSSLNHHEDTLNEFKQNTYQVILPISLDTNVKQSLVRLKNLTYARWQIIKEESNVATKVTTFYTFSEAGIKNNVANLPNGILERDFNGTIKKENFTKLPNNVLLSGLFYIKPPRQLTANQVKLTLETRLHTNQISIRTYKDNNHLTQGPNQLQLRLFLAFSVLLLLLSYVYDYFLSYKELALKLLSGYSKWNVLQDRFRKNLAVLWQTIILIIMFTICCIITFKYLQLLWLLQTGLVVFVFVLTAYLLAFLLFAILLTLFKPKESFLKGRYPARLIWGINVSVKIILMIALVLVSQNIVPTVKNTISVLATRHYTTKVLAGYQNTPLMPSQKAIQYENQHPAAHIKSSQKLFARLYSKKLLLFSPSDETRNTLLRTGKTSTKKIESNYVWVSPEYLKQVVIYDAKGKRITVSDNARNATILIPQNQLSQEKKIHQVMEKHYIEDAFSLGKGLISPKSSGQTASLPALKYATIQNNPKLLTFYDYYAGINNPIIMIIPKNIMTLPYSVCADDIAGMSDNFFFKSSQKSAYSIIRKSRLSNDFPKVIEADRFINTYLQDAVISSFIEGTLGFILVVSFIVMSFFSIESFLINRQRHLFLKKMMGYNFLDIFQIYLFVIILFWGSTCGYEILNSRLDIAIFCSFIGTIDLLISALVAKRAINQLGENTLWK